MYRLAVLVLALLALSVEGRPHVEDVEFDCRGQADGYYPDLSDRAAFFSCYEDSLIAKVVCEEGFEFDGVENCVEVQDNVDALEGQEEEEKQVSQLLQHLSVFNSDQDEADDDEVSEYGPYRNTTSTPKLVWNIEITKNIFPRSFIYIGRMNREQKNK